jgi:hypothetical protein
MAPKTHELNGGESPTLEIPHMQCWKRLGHVFCANRETQNIFSHASYPTPLLLDAERIRVFFSPRDALNRSCITYLDLAIDDEKFEILTLLQDPILLPGVRGTFDDSGVTVGSAVRDESQRIFLYYLGWSLGVTVPVQNFIGMAVSTPEATAFTRISDAPVLGRSSFDPLTLGYPWVLRRDSRWLMWYGSHLSWGREKWEMKHVIKDAESTDGINWKCRGRVAIPLSSPEELAVARPCVIFTNNKYRMWYSRRCSSYSLGYAESDDGQNWHRLDSAISFEGEIQEWENESIEYASVFELGEHLYILYNGNGYGRTGFGIAKLLL